MKKLILMVSALAMLLTPSLAHAQVAIRFGWAAPPPVVEVSPGVQVVENANDEIFFSNGRYWVERGGLWYASSDYRDHWVVVRPRFVPVFIRNHMGRVMRCAGMRRKSMRVTFVSWRGVIGGQHAPMRICASLGARYQLRAPYYRVLQ